MNKILLFGGTFDPIHKGHTHLVVEIQRLFDFDKVYFIPSKIPPHKKRKIASDKDRLKMIELAISDLPENKFFISDVELNNQNISYTYTTLCHYNQYYYPNELFFLVGSDIFATIKTWYKWNELIKLTNFILINRPGCSFDEMIQKIPTKLLQYIILYEDFEYGMSSKIILTKVNEIQTSSTQIRKAIKNGKYIDCLDKKVYQYIIENKLYMEE